MKKNLTIINQFIDKSIGEWKSIRSTHTLAFQEFENSTSKIYIKHINKKSKKPIWFINWFSNVGSYQSRFFYSLTKGKSYKK